MFIIKNTIQKCLILGSVIFLVNCGGASGSGDLPQKDQSAPTIKSYSPLDGQLDVADTVTISITFNEAITKFGVSNIVIQKYIDEVNTITLVDPILATNGVLYNSNTNTLTFIPRGGALQLKTRYRVLLRNIEDAAGNPMSEKSWDFGTIKNPIGAFQPIDGTLGVSLSSTIQIAFTEPMDLASLMKLNPKNGEQNPINFTLTAAGAVVPNTTILFSYDSLSNTASYSIKPNGLIKSTSYSAILSKLATDKNGIPLSKDLSTSFTTGASAGTGKQPPKPGNVSVIVKNGNALISWQKVTGTNISYNLYASTDSGASFNSVKRGVVASAKLSTISYSQPLTVGTAYLFAVTALDGVGGVESISSLASSEVTLIQPPNKPTGILLTTSTTLSGVSTATITWDYVSGLKYNLSVSKNNAAYNIVQKSITGPLVGSTPNQKIKFVQNNITAGVSYQYQLVAENSQGSLSLAVLSLKKTPVLATPSPTIISVVVQNGNALLTWQKVSGSNVSYDVGVSTNNGALYTSAKTGISDNTNATTITYTFALLVNNSYLFSVTAIKAGVKSTPSFSSNTVSLSPTPTKPSGVLLTTSTTVAGVSSATIVWDYISGMKYNLSVSVNGGAYTLVQNAITSPVLNQQIKFVDSPITTGASIKYRIISENAQGSLSPPAFSLVKTPSLTVPAPISVNAVIGDANVSLSWGNPDPTATIGLKYNIYLSKDNKVTFQQVASNLLGLNYFLRVANNISYHIAVTSVNSGGLESSKAYANNNTSFIPLASVTKLSSDSATCIIRDNGKGQNAGSIWCWGFNSSGQLGIGTKTTKEVPVQVGTVPTGSALPAQIWNDWISVSTGFQSACGIRKVNGTGPGLLYCWGDNYRGNLGIGNTVASLIPVLVNKPVSLGTTTVNWTKVSVGKQGHTCAIHSDATTVGELFCWGLNWYGQLGNTIGGNTAPSVSQPEPVAGANSTLTPYKDWLEISLGNYSTCGIRQESLQNTSLWCWGYNGQGESGNNDLTQTFLSLPTQEASLGTDWTSVTVGASHTCAIKAKTNTLWCWGANFYGSLGNGFSNANSNTSSSLVPAQEVTLAKDWIKVFTNNYNTCGLKSSGQISCWGKNDLGQTGNPLDRNGNNKSQISIFDKGWTELALGYNHTCGLTLSNNTLCWGSAASSLLGNIKSESASPRQTRKTNGAHLDNVTDISASKNRSAGGGNNVIAYQSSTNTLFAWGNNSSYQNTAAAPDLPNYQSAISITTTKAWKKISVSGGHSCAILVADDTLWCWGDDNPNNFVTKPITTPTQIGTGKWRDISVTGRQSCGIKLVVNNLGVPLADDQSLWCWGSNNSNGQLGIGNNTTVYSVPTAKVVSPLTTPVKWLSVAAGNFNTCAITTNNDLYCWGRAVYNIFGTGGTIETHKPTTAVTVAANPAINWVDVKISLAGACALTDTSSLYCWGNNNSGQAGSLGIKTKPALVSGGSGTWSDFDLGANHTCAIDLANSSLWCWGDNKLGQLGTGRFGPTANVSKGTPEQIIIRNTTAKWNKVSTGDYYTCAIRTDVPTTTNGVWCWGSNATGELGDRNSWKLTPVSVVVP